MYAWWDGLSALNRGFFSAAVFFGVLFVWQLAATLFGLGGDGLADGDVTADDVSGGDAAETMSAFKLLSIRSIVTFLTLFSWGGALYLADGRSVQAAVGLASLWGIAGMAVVALLLYALPKLAQTRRRSAARAPSIWTFPPTARARSAPRSTAWSPTSRHVRRADRL